MGYRSKNNGITAIRKRGSGQPPEHLSISKEYDTDPRKIYPVLLYVPDINKPEHYHIKLRKIDAIKLRDWLAAYLKEHA